MPADAALLTNVAEFDTATRGHHPDSPSSLQSSEACPLFLNEQRESIAATAGVLQHKASETGDLSILDSDEQRAAVQDCIDYARRVGVTPYSQEAEVLVIKEEYLGVGDEKVGEFIGVTGGFPDEVYVGSVEADVLDWKFGRIPVVPTKDNLQGISYALSLFQRFPKLERVRVHFRQPYQGWSEAEHEAKYVHTFLRSDCPALELRVRTVVARKKAAVARLEKTGGWQDATPRTDLCIWCARKGDCKRLHSVVIQGSEKHPDFIVPATLNVVELNRADVVKAAFKWATQVDKIAAAVKDRCRKLVLEENLELGEDIKVVKRVERQTKNIRELVAGARRAGVTLLELLPLVSVPFTKVEELVKKKAPKGKGAEAIRRLQADWLENGAVEMGNPVYFIQEAKSPKEKQQPIIEIES